MLQGIRNYHSGNGEEAFEYLKFKAEIYKRMQITENGVAYIFIDKAMQEEFNLTLEQASVCVGTLGGVPSDGEVVISSTNRNFKGRMGNNKAFIYLASPETVTVSAIAGEISDPRSYF